MRVLNKTLVCTGAQASTCTDFEISEPLVSGVGE